MKLRSLHLSNFRSHSDSRLSLDRLNVVRGLNGSGKSSLQMAVELLLTGRCAVTDAAGRGAEVLVRSGAKELVIEASVELKAGAFPITLRRSAAGGMLTVGNVAAGKNALAWIEQNVAPIEVLSAVLNAHRFLEMKPAEQKALLAGALASEPVKVDDEVSRLMHALGIACSGLVSSASDVDANYKGFYDMRADLNRQIKALGDIAAPEKAADLPAYAQVQEKLKERKDERDELMRRITAARASESSAHHLLEAARAQKAQHEKNILSEPDFASLQKVFKNKERAAALDVEISDLQGQLTAARDAVARVKATPDACPTCERPYGDEHRAHRAEQMREQEQRITDLESRLSKAQTARTKLDDPDQAEIRLGAHKQALIAVARAEETLKGGAPTATDTSQWEADLKALEERINRGEGIARQALEYESSVAAHQRIAEKKQVLEDKVALVEKLVAYFGPNGDLKGKLIGGRLPAFRERINAALGRFGFSCFFELEPYRLGIDVRTCGDSNVTGSLSLQQLSESEAYRFSIAFQIALAEATGVGLVVIDRADMLAPEVRKQLTAELMSSRLDQAIVLSTAAPSQPPASPKGVAFFNLVNEDGNTAVFAFAEETDAAVAS